MITVQKWSHFGYFYGCYKENLLYFHFLLIEDENCLRALSQKALGKSYFWGRRDELQNERSSSHNRRPGVRA